MPIEVRYTDDDLGIDFCAVGRVTGKDVIESKVTIFQEEGFARLKYWIVDRSRCVEYEVNADDVRSIAELDNEAAKINPDLLIALISETDLQFGMSRMYEAHIDEFGFKTKSFRDRASANEWIQKEMQAT